MAATYMYPPNAGRKSDVFNTGFKSVRIFKEQVLGRGAYGSVCKAKCDQLDCAAKILHPTLFDRQALLRVAQRREHRLPVSRFERECEYMNAIRHPNIVQYLGVIQDEATKLPAILMELMKESLTTFLKRSAQSIPYHTQVNICHDVTLALTYLHSNNIIHRDLSSNNVLLLSDLRAKVTDFGMAKLGDLNPHSAQHHSFTVCPGTQVFMPPEAVQTNPSYSEKIDCFSFGVLTIQILTRQFPNPGEPLQNVDMSLAGVPRGRLMQCVSEIDRRLNHISLVKKDHPLLPVSLDCLKDKDVERPTAKELCQRISDLKEKTKYKESVKAEEDRNTLELERKEDELKTLKRNHAQQVDGFQSIILSQKLRLEEINRRVEEKEYAIREKEEVIDRQSHIITQKEELLQKNNDESLKATLVLEEEIQALKNRVQQLVVNEQGNKEQEQSDINPRLKAQIADLNRKIELSKRVISQKEETIRRLENTMSSKQMDIHHLTQQLEQTKAEFEKEIQKGKGREKQVKQNEEIISIFQRRISSLEQQLKQSSTQQYSIRASQHPPATQLLQSENQQHNLNPCTTTRAAGFTEAHARGMSALKLRWTQGSGAPKEISRGPDPVVHGNFVYFVPSTSVGRVSIMCYDVANRSWLEISSYPYCTNSFSLAFLDNQLTGIGGSGDNSYTNKLFSLQADRGGFQRWMEVFPPMPTKRSNTSVLVSGGHLIVIGGKNENASLDIVEVMNIESHQWFTSIPLPEPITGSSVAICGERVYILGGEVGRYFNSSQSVYSCSLSSLLQCATHAKSPNTAMPLYPYQLQHSAHWASDKWSRVANTPVYRSTCLSFRGQLLTFGGEDSEKRSTTAVHMYDQHSNSWSLVSHMITARTGCFVALLPTNQLMVVGGWTKRALILFTVPTNDIEFGIAP